MATTDRPKVYYFDTPGRAEIVRILLVYAGKEFDDIRFTREEWVKSYKAQSPLGMAPFYEEAGVKLGGSCAISRYIAEGNGLGGRTPFENAQLESYVDVVLDVGNKINSLLAETDKNREKCQQECLKDFPGRFAYLEKQVKSAKHFLSGDKLSWADFIVSNIFMYLNFAGLGAVVRDCPKLAAVAANIDEIDKVKEWRRNTHKHLK